MKSKPLQPGAFFPILFIVCVAAETVFSAYLPQAYRKYIASDFVKLFCPFPLT
jgi:hypothetical protein